MWGCIGCPSDHSGVFRDYLEGTRGEAWGRLYPCSSECPCLLSVGLSRDSRTPDDYPEHLPETSRAGAIGASHFSLTMGGYEKTNTEDIFKTLQITPLLPYLRQVSSGWPIGCPVVASYSPSLIIP